jgi:hypothetical protein
MCLFSYDPNLSGGAPINVAGTRIFARGATGGRQLLAYSMRYASHVDMAMVLPLPTPPAPGDDAVEFIDLSAYPDFFEDLDRGFPEFRRPDTSGFSVATLSLSDAPPLAVRSVGSFEASFVPSRADFARLDARFRLSERVLDALPLYRDYSFAVFKLKPGRTEVHPMAFAFPRRNTAELFFPTVHVHDGTVAPEARFDHCLYCQSASAPASSGWETSRRWVPSAESEAKFEAWLRTQPRGEPGPFTEDEKRLLRKLNYPDDYDYVGVPVIAATFVDADRSKGIVAGNVPVRRMRLNGMLANKDTFFADVPTE